VCQGCWKREARAEETGKEKLGRIKKNLRATALLPKHRSFRISSKGIQIKRGLWNFASLLLVRYQLVKAPTYSACCPSSKVLTRLKREDICL